MKKILTGAALIVAGTMFVSAQVDATVQAEVTTQVQPETGTPVRPSLPNLKAKAVQVIKANNPTMGEGGAPTTGDAATDAQLKALFTEMEAKIKVIRDEYQAKIKAVIAARVAANGTTTRPVIRKEAVNNGNQFGRLKMASTTDGAVPAMPRLRIEGQVKGEFSENQGQGGVIKFLRGLFGGN